MNKNLKKIYLDDDSIDLVELISKIWNKKKTILYTTIIFLLLGIVYSLSLNNIYESSSTFYPHYEKAENNSLKNLAGLAGINLDQNRYTDIPTSLYPNLIKSVPFKKNILNEEIEINSKKITYRDYLINRNPSIISILFEYTIKLPLKLITFIKSFASTNSNSEIKQNENYLSFNNTDYSLFKSLDNIIILKSNIKDGYLTLSVQDQIPEVAAQIAQIAQEKLQERINNYKLKNTMILYDYTSSQAEKRKNEFYYLQDSLANFKDSNRSIKSDLFLNQLERLQYEVNLTNSIYKELALSKEKVNLEIKKNTPIFTIINPVILPNHKLEPNRTLIVFAFTFIGLIISIVSVLNKKFILRIKKLFHNKKVT